MNGSKLLAVSIRRGLKCSMQIAFFKRIGDLKRLAEWEAERDEVVEEYRRLRGSGYV